MIKIVTITGADNSVDPVELFKLSDKYPFVEWAILVSRTSSGTRRFPPFRWIDKLIELNTEHILSGKPSINLSMHLCGSYVRELLTGKDEFIEEELTDTWNAFSRVQINTHAEPHKINTLPLAEALGNYPDKEFIFQYDGVNADELLALPFMEGTKYSALFDLSHGTGVLPESWPDMLPGVKCGYAGGIGPDNIADQMALINSKVGTVDTWIDMETKVRSNGDLLFDLFKVEKCLQIAKEFIK